MKYRQWKKNYKKKYGYNPPSKKQQQKQLENIFSNLPDLSNFSEAFNNAIGNMFRAAGEIADRVGSGFRNAADNINPLELKGQQINWEVHSVVCDYGVYENGELKLITNSYRAANKIVEILNADRTEYARLKQTNRIIESEELAI